MNYKVEDLKFLNMEKERIYVSSPRNRGGLHIFKIERTLSEEEKLDIIDKLRDGVGTYLFEIFKKWESEKGSLPQNQYGSPKTISKIAWIKRNDSRSIINRNNYKLGNFWLFKTEFKEMSITCPPTEYGYSMEYTGQSIVHQWFHDLCQELYYAEKKYFEENDPKEIKLSKVKELGKKYHVYFEDKDLNDIIWNQKKEVSEKRLDEFIEAYEKLGKSIEKISLELNK